MLATPRQRGEAETPTQRVAVRFSTALVLAASCATGCSPHQVRANPDPPVDIPTSYAGARDGTDVESWWLELDDPQLEHLIERAFSGNLELAGAWARLEQARAAARSAGAGKWPQISAEARASRQESRNLFADTESDDLPFEIDDTLRQDLVSVDVAASYEVDLWRKLDSQERAAALDANAARDSAETLAISLAAQVAEAWYDVVVEHERQRLLESQVEVNETFLELVELRFRRGLSSVLDVHQQRQQLRATRAQVALSESRAAVGRHQLAVLVGEAPGAEVVEERAELPPLPPAPDTGLPGDLLERRPDVRAARRRVEAADYRIAAAIAEKLPSLSLSASGGFQSSSVVDLLTTPVYSLAASLGQVIFSGGRLSAEVDRSEAVRRERVADYGQSLLEALLEVEGALAQERKQREYIAERARELESARAALREARARYREGLSEFLPVLTALQSVQALELELLGAERQALSFRIQLYRALGGAWPGELAPPEAEGRSS